MSVPSDFFADLYARSVDPWKIGSGWYEQRKRDLLLALLPQAQYQLALEPACGNGDLTARLRPRCARVVAWDAVAAAVAATRERFSADAQVEVSAGRLPADWPRVAGADLLVLSEIGYYLDPADLDRALALAQPLLARGASVAAVHWRRPIAGCPQTGDEVHDRLRGKAWLTVLAEYIDADVRIDVFAAFERQPQSVAQRQALAG